MAKNLYRIEKVRVDYIMVSANTKEEALELAKG